MIVSDVNESSLDEMDLLVDEGVTSFKLFMAYPGVFYSTDGEILQAMQRARATAADHHDARRERHRHRRARRPGPRPRRGPTRAFTASTRPVAARGRGHAPRHRSWRGSPARRSTSSTSRRAEALDEVVAARDRGQNVFAETCPQYLFLSDADLAREGFEGAKFVCSPPLRPARPTRPTSGAGCAPTT